MRIFNHCSPPLSRTAKQNLSWAAPWGTSARSAGSRWREAWQSTRNCSSVGDQGCWQSLMIESAASPAKECHWNVMIQRSLSQHYPQGSQDILRLTEPLSPWSCFWFQKPRICSKLWLYAVPLQEVSFCAGLILWERQANVIRAADKSPMLQCRLVSLDNTSFQDEVAHWGPQGWECLASPCRSFWMTALLLDLGIQSSLPEFSQGIQSSQSFTAEPPSKGLAEMCSEGARSGIFRTSTGLLKNPQGKNYVRVGIIMILYQWYWCHMSELLKKYLEITKISSFP